MAPSFYDMKKNFFSILKKDKIFLGILFAYIIFGLLMILIIALNIHPHETKIVTRYSVFGTKNNYRESWWSLISLIGFVAVNLVAHIAIAYKIYRKNRKTLAKSFLLAGVVVLVMFSFILPIIFSLASAGS